MSAAALAPNGKTLATYFFGGDATGLRLWDLDTGKQRGQLTPYTEPIRGMVFSPDGKMLVVAGTNLENRDNPMRQVSFIELSTGTRKMALRGQEPSMLVPMAFSADGRFLATASEKQKTIVVWNASGDKR